tara:strand:- start:235 stop:2061 length:1827 start_codon:yes stop_codon:yes gene_type:complete
MADVVVHRGPDDSGYYFDKNISLGHRRLSIIDLSLKGRNPMPNENKDIWIIFNGEIYNYLRLKPKLEEKGHTFFSNTDTEVIIHAYEEYGVECLKYLEGAFAFAIWDSEKKELFIARDRMGIKPLYYYFKNGKFIFASEIKSILQYEGVERKMSKSGYIQLILQSFSIDGQTLFEDIKELLPAHYIVLKDKSLEIKRYWDVNVNITNESEKFYVDNTRKLMFDSVKDRMMSDVPIGAALSGGIDCSTIVGILSKLSEEPVKTFTMGFNDPLDEFDEARLVAEHCGTNHKEVALSYEQVTKNLPKILWHMELPYARPAIFPNFFLGEIAKKFVTVAYCGEGGDEVFAGYNRYAPFAPKPTLKETMDKFNSGIYKDLEKWYNAGKEKKISRVSWGLFNDGPSREIFNLNNGKKYETETLFSPFLKGVSKDDYLNYALLFDIKYEIPGAQTWRVDRTTMASSTEFRFPYLDHRLIEFSVQIPPSFKFNGTRKKYVLQEVAKDLLPEKIVYRRKFPFGIPIMRYFKKDFIHVVDSLLDKKTIAKRPYLNGHGITKLIDGVKKMEIGKLDKIREIKDSDLRKLLLLTNLELWQRMFIENDDMYKPSMKIEDYL